MTVTCPKCGGPTVTLFVNKQVGTKVTCVKKVGK